MPLVRAKNGFHADAKVMGGYRDCKLNLLCVIPDAPIGPVRLITEVQLLLDEYVKVKERMHGVYRAARGDFDVIAARGAFEKIASAVNKSAHVTRKYAADAGTYVAATVGAAKRQSAAQGAKVADAVTKSAPVVRKYAADAGTYITTKFQEVTHQPTAQSAKVHPGSP